MKFKFTIGEIVVIAGIECVILEQEIYDNIPDYLCKPLDELEMILGQWELGSGWVRECDISTK